MAKGRGSAGLLLLILGIASVIQCTFVEGRSYTVGDGQGWGFQIPYPKWTAKKPFRAGDILVFNYPRTFHDVMPVNAVGYRNCQVPARARRFNSGRDRLKLKRGWNFFICSVPDHCQSGMKIAVKAI